ncbi:MAG: hypothetical protein ABIH50_06440 [bacterium]
MNKTVVSLLAIAFLATSVLAAAGRFQIYSDKGSGFGWGKRTVLLDTETGKTWKLDGKKWQILQRGAPRVIVPPIIPTKESMVSKATTTIKPQPVDLSVKIKLAEELAALKKKYAEDMKEMRRKLSEKEKAIAKAKAVKKTKPATTAPEENSESEETPPAWLSE